MAAMQGALLALLLHPSVQTLAQTELDRVIGRDRLPDFSDRPNLPYVNAICREVLRLNPVLPLALAHAVLRDDVYGGLYVPKGVSFTVFFDTLDVEFMGLIGCGDDIGSLVMGNSWYELVQCSIFLEVVF